MGWESHGCSTWFSRCAACACRSGMLPCCLVGGLWYVHFVSSLLLLHCSSFSSSGCGSEHEALLVCICVTKAASLPCPWSTHPHCRTQVRAELAKDDHEQNLRFREMHMHQRITEKLQWGRCSSQRVAEIRIQTEGSGEAGTAAAIICGSGDTSYEMGRFTKRCV